MARDLEADLKVCDAANRIGKFSPTGMSHATVQLATGWAETIRELMEARKRIAKLDECNDSLLAEIAELEEVMDRTRLEAKKKLDEAGKRIAELEEENVGLKEGSEYLREELAALEARLEEMTSE